MIVIVVVEDLGVDGGCDNNVLGEEWSGFAAATFDVVRPFVDHLEEFVESDFSAEIVKNHGLLTGVPILPAIVGSPNIVGGRLKVLKGAVRLAHAGWAINPVAGCHPGAEAFAKGDVFELMQGTAILVVSKWVVDNEVINRTAGQNGIANFKEIGALALGGNGALLNNRWIVVMVKEVVPDLSGREMVRRGVVVVRPGNTRLTFLAVAGSSNGLATAMARFDVAIVGSFMKGVEGDFSGKLKITLQMRRLVRWSGSFRAYDEVRAFCTTEIDERSKLSRGVIVDGDTGVAKLGGRHLTYRREKSES